MFILATEQETYISKKLNKSVKQNGRFMDFLTARLNMYRSFGELPTMQPLIFKDLSKFHTNFFKKGNLYKRHVEKT